MTPQEQEMLDGLIGRVQSSPLTSKDTEADRHIQDALGQDPNALYILCQTVLLQGYALEQAQKQMATLKEQAAQPQQAQHEPTFLEKIFGRSDPEPPPQVPGQANYGGPVYNQAQYGQQGYTRPGYGQPVPTAYPGSAYPTSAYPVQPGYGTPYSPYGGVAPMGSSGGGFLQGALQTAAGVALGEIAFQSVEGLFRGFGHAAGYGSDRAVGFGDVRDAGDGDYGQGGGFFSREQAENGVNDQLSPDIEDRRDERSGLSDAGNFGPADAFTEAEQAATYSGDDMDSSVVDADGSDFSDAGFDSGSDDGGSFDDN